MTELRAEEERAMQERFEQETKRQEASLRRELEAEKQRIRAILEQEQSEKKQRLQLEEFSKQKEEEIKKKYEEEKRALEDELTKLKEQQRLREIEEGKNFMVTVTMVTEILKKEEDWRVRLLFSKELRRKKKDLKTEKNWMTNRNVKTMKVKKLKDKDEDNKEKKISRNEE